MASEAGPEDAQDEGGAPNKVAEDFHPGDFV